ncbi:UNVERIFIED_CONTAM: putative minor capsid protein, partial [Kocuria sp. CPCC 205274]
WLRMLTLQPDPRWLVDSFVYEPIVATDRFSQPVFGTPVPLTKVRIDWHETFARDGVQKTKIGDGVVFVYANFSLGIPTAGFKEDSDVTIEGKTYKIKAVRKYHRITSSNPFSWELVII